MSDYEARRVFTQLLETKPPLPDVEPYVLAGRAARNRHRRRRYVAGGALSVAAVAGALLVVPNVIANRPATTGQTAATAESEQAKAARLTNAFRGIDGWLPAGATVTAKPQLERPPRAMQHGRPLVVYPPAGLPAMAFWYSGIDYRAEAHISSSTHVAEISVTLGKSDATIGRLSRCPKPTATYKPECAVSPNGDIVVLSRGLTPTGPFASVSVEVWRSDGTYLFVSSAAYGELVRGLHGDGKIPFTNEQLLKIANEPKLSYNP